MATYNRKLTEELKKVAFSNHVDFIGVSDLRVFDDIPISERPRGILDDAKAVVVYAVKYKDVNCFFDESWWIQLEELLTRIDKKLTEFLTEKGYKAHSFLRASAPHNLYDELHKQSSGEGSPPHHGKWFRVFHKMQNAAVAAGIGGFNKNRMIIIPQYGPYFYISMIITDAPLEPDDPFDEDLCADCNLCIEACPTGALTGKGLPDASKCKPMECHFTCLRVCHEKFLKQRHQPTEPKKST
jgi:epoxyqueuosine reductase QueG